MMVQRRGDSMMEIAEGNASVVASSDTPILTSGFHIFNHARLVKFIVYVSLYVV